jgi:L-serine dehydratase
MGVFDIVGPVMIGPSSSHTAGAVRLGKMARGILGESPAAAVITLYGSFAKTYRGHGTDRALVAGLLGMSPADPQIKQAFELATQVQLQIDIHPVEQGESDPGGHSLGGHTTRPFNVGANGACKIQEVFHPNVHAPVAAQNCECKLPDGNLHPNTALIELTGASGKQVGVLGVSVGGGQIRICRINEYPVELTGEYHTLIAAYRDKPGMIAEVTRILASENVNIAFMRVARQERGAQALMILESDQKAPENALAAIRALPAVESAILVEAL